MLVDWNNLKTVFEVRGISKSLLLCIRNWCFVRTAEVLLPLQLLAHSLFEHIHIHIQHDSIIHWHCFWCNCFAPGVVWNNDFHVSTINRLITCMTRPILQLFQNTFRFRSAQTPINRKKTFEQTLFSWYTLEPHFRYRYSKHRIIFTADNYGKESARPFPPNLITNSFFW